MTTKQYMSMRSHKLIGLIAGLGPYAGSDVMEKLFTYSAQQHGAVLDEDYPNLIVLSKGLTGYDKDANLSPTFEMDLIKAVDQVEQNKPDILGIACNTAHIFTGELIKHTKAKFVSIIDATVEEARKQDVLYVVLSSSITRTHQLYYQKLDAAGVRYVDISNEQQKVVNKAINLVMSGHKMEGGRTVGALLDDLLRANPEIKGVIAGCTEIPIALNESKISYPLLKVDSNGCLARALADTYYGRR